MLRLSHRLIVLWTMPLILFVLFFPSPARAAGTCEAPRPESPAVDLLIKEAQARGGAAANVPAKVLKAIYSIEATTAYANPSSYSCQQNTPGSNALGLMQVLDDTYERVVPDAERFGDEGACAVTNCKLSRCNPVDAMEIAARALLSKIFLWDETADKPLGKLTSATDTYYASCRYYGIFTPDGLTNELAKRLPPDKVPADGTMSYCEYVTLYSGLYTSPSQLPPRTDKPYSGTKSSVKFTFDACTQPTTPPISANFKVHPLRPNPDDPISADAPLTPFCVMRPLPVEQNRINKRVPYAGAPIVDIKTVGTLTQDFRKFITPLLSITDPKKPDYSLPFNEKAQRYLLDFLEGRAYYEPFIEPANPTQAQISDLFNRLGVFRKLAPKTYQDELKRALIQRAAGSFGADNPYGFEPASATIHNYTVGSWQGQTVTLTAFVNNWAPLPKEFENNPDETYAQAYETWKNQDGGKWYSLWPYVPMFTREDTKGTIVIKDSNPPPDPYSPTGQWIEENESSKDTVNVSHPHLARAYEVTTSLSYMLTPQKVHENAPVPILNAEWLPKLWEGNSTWLDPSYKKPNINVIPPLEFGPVCDVDPSVITLISSSGDPALDSQFTTAVNRQDLNLTHAMINGEESVLGSARPEDKKNCGAQYDCETCIETGSYYDPILRKEVVTYSLDDTACYYYKQIRSSPNYLISYTPFLNEILTSLSGGQRGLFDLFKPAGLPEQPYEKFDWPGVGNAGEESPKYSFSAGKAEAGARKPGDSQSYYYRYLGSLQCAKERVMQVLQPFISGSPYTPYAYDCFPELTPPTGPITPVPPQNQWLQWPCADAYVEDDHLSVCYKDPRRPAHSGLDLQCPGGIIYPSAQGKVVAVNNSPGAHGFGIYVIIDHGNGWFTLYAHLQSTSVSVGGQVGLNTPIGRQDNTGSWSFGSHLHLGLAKGGSPSNFLVSGPTADPCAAISGCSCSP